MSNIVLIGPPGSGKSAVGRRLARELGRAFIDSDDEIEARTGVDIPYIFEKEGEAGFRRRERDVIAELAARENIVLATGGGAVLDADNRACISACGHVVYLHASVDEQLRRTRRGRARPLLNNPRPRETLEKLLEARDPLYQKIASFIVETNRRTVAAVVAEILATLDDAPGG